MLDSPFIYILMGFGYIVVLHGIPFSLNPKKHPYNQLFSNLYLLHLLWAIGCATLGLIRINEEPTASMLFAPLIYLVLFKAANFLSLLLNKRNLIICSKFDYKVPEHNWIDSILTFVIFVISLCFCLYLGIHWEQIGVFLFS